MAEDSAEPRISRRTILKATPFVGAGIVAAISGALSGLNSGPNTEIIMGGHKTAKTSPLTEQSGPTKADLAQQKANAHILENNNNPLLDQAPVLPPKKEHLSVREQIDIINNSYNFGELTVEKRGKPIDITLKAVNLAGVPIQQDGNNVVFDINLKGVKQYNPATGPDQLEYKYNSSSDIATVSGPATDEKKRILMLRTHSSSVHGGVPLEGEAL